eukprot:jgi/Orpsp1_1/1187576/evm.model.d7180000058725.1
MLNFIIILLIFGTIVSARDVIFNVIGFGTNMQVSINGQIYNLLNRDVSEPFFQSKILNIDDNDI